MTNETEAEENARISDAEYRQRVIEETVQSFFDLGYSHDHADALVGLIESGKIKNVFIKF